MRTLLVACAALVLVVAMVATAAGYGVDRDRYVAANEAILDELPLYPSSTRTSTQSSPYYAGDSDWSPVDGYVTLAFFDLQDGTTPERVASFYERELAAEWDLTRKITEPPFAAGPILDYRRGEAELSVNLESWRAGVLEIAVDHAGT